MAYQIPADPVNKSKPKTIYVDKSRLGQLNDHLKVRIRLCDKLGNFIEGSTEQIVCLGIEGEVSIDNQYSTPFENSNPEQKLPTLMGQLQSGDWVNTLNSVIGSLFGTNAALSNVQKEKLNALEGRSNLTKLNSTQIYVSTQSITMPFTLMFEAWADAKIEVEDQLDLLKKWSLPISLSDQSLISSVAEDPSLTSLFPSEVPPFVSISYGGKRYAPMLIGNFSEPLANPKDKDGNRLLVVAQTSFMSRTAWDKDNISGLYNLG
ncbi:hypothetical protein KPE71_13860 [Acinetobacter soli]|uniref:hypothetical protein n=1 Tax=Acinetobacter soli TaxID=487316 RepID=UPI001C0AEB1C|nr:hypothetical protein [Acinetobacter soli]MBU3121339.1 hypothetical protein [Acinetobacter soli]